MTSMNLLMIFVDELLMTSSIQIPKLLNISALSSVDFFFPKIYFFIKNLSGTLSECQTVWITLFAKVIRR